MSKLWKSTFQGYRTIDSRIVCARMTVTRARMADRLPPPGYDGRS